MPLFWFQLTPRGEENIKKLYKEITGKEYVPPTEKIESSAELEKLMKIPTRFKRPK